MSEEKKPLTQEEYTLSVFFLMGQFMGVMSTVTAPGELTVSKAKDLIEIRDQMQNLYLRSKEAGL